MIKRMSVQFIWDTKKELLNIKKHNVDFHTAKLVFLDRKRKIFIDSKHSQSEERYYCIGKVCGKILTVRFMYRFDKIRIIGAGYWRKGKSYYEQDK